MKWRVDYRAQANQAGDKLDLAGWVTVTNETGTTFKDAQVKLMAGEVHRVKAAEAQILGGAISGVDFGKKISNKAFGEYHLYELGHKTTITDHATKQLELLNLEGIPVTHKYETARNEDRVAVVMEFKNSEQTVKGLGIPLPKGVIRVFQAGADGVPEYVGEDEIDHTPKDERVRVRLGYAFDLKVERRTLAVRETKDKRSYDLHVRVRNHKAEPVAVDVIDPVPGLRDLEVSANSHPFTRRDVNTLVFGVTVPANGETVVRYTAGYTK
jgi:hypothetical protein